MVLSFSFWRWVIWKADGLFIGKNFYGLIFDFSVATTAFQWTCLCFCVITLFRLFYYLFLKIPLLCLSMYCTVYCTAISWFSFVFFFITIVLRVYCIYFFICVCLLCVSKRHFCLLLDLNVQIKYLNFSQKQKNITILNVFKRWCCWVLSSV